MMTPYVYFPSEGEAETARKSLPLEWATKVKQTVKGWCVEIETGNSYGELYVSGGLGGIHWFLGDKAGQQIDQMERVLRARTFSH